jgi:hypothetical protein
MHIKAIVSILKVIKGPKTMKRDIVERGDVILV